MKRRSSFTAQSVVLPLSLLQDMWTRAGIWDVGSGGRFDARGTTLLIWSKPPCQPGQAPAVPIGSVSVRWQTPTPQQAMICHMDWDAEHGGSEAILWQGLEILAGRPLAPEAQAVHAPRNALHRGLRLLGLPA